MWIGSKKWMRKRKWINSLEVGLEGAVQVPGLSQIATAHAKGKGRGNAYGEGLSCYDSNVHMVSSTSFCVLERYLGGPHTGTSAGVVTLGLVECTEYYNILMPKVEAPVAYARPVTARLRQQPAGVNKRGRSADY